MIVHFSSSSKNIARRAKILSAMMNHIKITGHTLSREWLTEATNVSAEQKADMQRWKKISSETLQALKRADVVIIEASVDSFSMGYQAALALQLKKPLLILRSQNSSVIDGEINVYSEDKPVEQSLLAGDQSSLSHMGIYKDITEAEVLLDKFLDANNLDKTDMRFNMFLDRESYQFLDRVSQQTGQTKAKIVRDLLKEKNRD